MISEHDLVILTHDLPAHGLKGRRCRHVVFVHRDGAAYEVGFTTPLGETLGVETLRAGAVRKPARAKCCTAARAPEAVPP